MANNKHSILFVSAQATKININKRPTVNSENRLELMAGNDSRCSSLQCGNKKADITPELWRCTTLSVWSRIVE